MWRTVFYWYFWLFCCFSLLHLEKVSWSGKEALQWASRMCPINNSAGQTQEARAMRLFHIFISPYSFPALRRPSPNEAQLLLVAIATRKRDSNSTYFNSRYIYHINVSASALDNVFQKKKEIDEFVGSGHWRKRMRLPTRHFPLCVNQ